MLKLLNEWLFTGITASTVLMSIFTLRPSHPLAMAARTLGYGLALLCVFGAAVSIWLRSRHRRDQYSDRA